jgi:hypothetical protein
LDKYPNYPKYPIRIKENNMTTNAERQQRIYEDKQNEWLENAKRQRAARYRKESFMTWQLMYMVK